MSADFFKYYETSKDLEEHLVWECDVSKTFAALPENVRDIWQYCFTEMFNNAIDHAGGTTIAVSLKKSEGSTSIHLADDGIGIFRKIQTELGLTDERQAILELSKGKLTTDPQRHSGQGIFFTSRMLDEFNILSGGIYFNHDSTQERDWALLEDEEQGKSGTAVFMKLADNATRNLKHIFDQYSSGDDYGFTKTVVPVKLAQYGNDKLVSRSQAKRLLSRVDRFKTVVFDFAGVDVVGLPFTDEIFRVFANSHPEIELVAVNENAYIGRLMRITESST